MVTVQDAMKSLLLCLSMGMSSVLNVVQLYMIAVKEKEHESGKDDVRQAQEVQ